MPFCPQCGTKNADGARFCVACGATVAAPGAAPMPPQPQQAAPPQGPYIGPPPPAQQSYVPPPQGGYVPPPGGYAPPGYAGVPAAKKKSPMIAGLLGFFLAGFGAQAFYNGQMKKGLAQLAVVWILWIVIVTPAAASGNTGFAWLLGLVIGGVAGYDGQKIAEKINAGVPVGEFAWF